MVLVVALAFAVATAGSHGSAADATTSGRVTTVAIVPVAGERVSLEEVPLYTRVDTLLRQAAAAHDITLQPVDVTKAHLSTLRDSGIDCDLTDRLCLAKIAVLTEVSRLLVPIGRREGSTFHMRILVVDGAGSSRELKGDVTLSDDGDADARLAMALVRAALVAGLESDKKPVDEPPPPPPPPPPPATTMSDLPWLGLSVIGASAAVMLTGGIGALVVEDSLQQAELYENRQAKMAVGQLCLVGVGVGVIGAGFGGLLVWLGE